MKKPKRVFARVMAQDLSTAELRRVTGALRKPVITLAYVNGHAVPSDVADAS